MIKLLHCADLHMGAAFPELGSRRGRLLREAQKSAWLKILETARARQADLILVAGDLFDSNHISEDALGFFFQSIEGYPLPLCLLPGMHDPDDRYGVYRDKRFSAQPNLHLFDTREPRAVLFPGLDLTVHGRAVPPGSGKMRPLSGLKPSGESRYNIAMAHGTLDKDHRCPEDCCVNLEDIEHSGMQYIALGHDHAFRECSAGTTRAFYSGPPEALGFGQAGGDVLVVALDGPDVDVRRESIGRYRWHDIDLEADQGRPEKTAAEIARFKGEHSLLKVRMTGRVPFYRIPGLRAVFEEAADDFFYLDFSLDGVSMDVRLPASRMPGLSLPGQFHRLMQEKLKDAPPDKRRLYEDALWLGYLLLTEA
jgi:DNA repair exonuclease SbcCD nuclease subunit